MTKVFRLVAGMGSAGSPGQLQVLDLSTAGTGQLHKHSQARASFQPAKNHRTTPQNRREDHDRATTGCVYTIDTTFAPLGKSSAELFQYCSSQFLPILCLSDVNQITL